MNYYFEKCKSWIKNFERTSDVDALSKYCELSVISRQRWISPASSGCLQCLFWFCPRRVFLRPLQPARPCTPVLFFYTQSYWVLLLRKSRNSFLKSKAKSNSWSRNLRHQVHNPQINSSRSWKKRNCVICGAKFPPQTYRWCSTITPRSFRCSQSDY